MPVVGPLSEGVIMDDFEVIELSLSHCMLLNTNRRNSDL